MQVLGSGMGLGGDCK